MATSGSTDYNLTRTNIIQEALELIGVYDPGESVSAEDAASCSRSLNMMVKSWMADGFRVWKISEGTLTLTANTQSYTLGPGGDLVIDKPLRIFEARRRDSDNIDTPLFSMSRDEWAMLTNKSEASIPTQYYYQPDLTTGTFYVWPPADTTAASEYTIKISYYSLLEDFDANSDNPDFPSEWLECLAYNLAVRIAPKFQVMQIPQSVTALAVQLKDQLDSWGEEFESVYLGPDFTYGG